MKDEVRRSEPSFGMVSFSRQTHSGGGWRNELGFDLIGKHFQTFNSQKADILKGDKLPNVEVLVVNA